MTEEEIRRHVEDFRRYSINFAIDKKVEAQLKDKYHLGIGQIITKIVKGELPPAAGLLGPTQ